MRVRKGVKRVKRVEVICELQQRECGPVFAWQSRRGCFTWRTVGMASNIIFEITGCFPLTWKWSDPRKQTKSAWQNRSGAMLVWVQPLSLVSKSENPDVGVQYFTAVFIHSHCRRDQGLFTHHLILFSFQFNQNKYE